MTRLQIWKRTDYIGEEPHRRELNVHGVSSESELPLCLAYNHAIPPIGRVKDIRIDADPDEITGEITCEIEFLDPAWLKPEIQIIDGYVCFVDGAPAKPYVACRWRLAIYANSLVENVDSGGRRVVQACTMREVSLIPEPAWPESEVKG